MDSAQGDMNHVMLGFGSGVRSTGPAGTARGGGGGGESPERRVSLQPWETCSWAELALTPSPAAWAPQPEHRASAPHALMSRSRRSAFIRFSSYFLNPFDPHPSVECSASASRARTVGPGPVRDRTFAFIIRGVCNQNIVCNHASSLMVQVGARYEQ